MVLGGAFENFTWWKAGQAQVVGEEKKNFEEEKFVGPQESRAKVYGKVYHGIKLSGAAC